MTRLRRVLVAVVLTAIPLNAQVMPGASPSPIPPFAPAVFAAPSSSFQSAVTAQPLAPALIAAPLPTFAVPIFAAASPDLPFAAGEPDHTSPPNDLPRFDASGQIFDGQSSFKTRSGSLFVLSRDPHPKIGAKVLVRVQTSPLAPIKAVPDTQGLVGRALLERVGQIAAKNQRVHEYHAASHYLFSVADNHTLNGLHGVADAYSGVFIPGTSDDGHDYSETGDKAGEGYARPQVMNVEHVFPQSYFDGELPMRSDLHHLMATLEHPNFVRENLPFGVVDEKKGGYHNVGGAKRGGKLFEPPDFTKGRVARAMLYFYARYKDMPFFDERASNFWNAQIETLLDWNRRFPPTLEERTRNDQVESFQGNRNPFVDDWKLADRIRTEVFLSEPSRDSLAEAGRAHRRSDVPRNKGPLIRRTFPHLFPTFKNRRH